MTGNKTKHALVPKLRFREFDDEWKSILLDDFAKRGSGHTPNKSHKEYYNGNIYWVSLSDSNKLDNGYIENTNTKISDLGIKNSSAVLHPEGTVILSRDAGVGKSAVLKYPMAVSQHFIVWRAIKNTSSNWFLYYWLQIKKPEFERIAIGNTIKTIGLPYFKKLNINAPSYSEQQKIASFLSAVDEKFQLLTRKKELLENYKKGAMQQLFSQKLRFKEENGKNFPDWEEKRLGEIAIITMGQSPDSNSYNTDSLGMLLIQGNADIKARVTIPRQWTSQPTKTCEIGDLILTVRAPVGLIAKSILKGCIGRGVCSIRNNKKSVQEYLFQFFLNYESRWIGLEQGSTFTAISGNDIKGLKLNLPSLPEQQKIASFLSSIDEKIEAVNHQIIQSQTFKKGLLQQMFV